MRRRLSEQEFEMIFSRVPRLCVEVVVRTEEGVILTKREQKSWHGWWHIPGGMVMYGEKLEEAVVRVAKAELGVAVEVLSWLGVIYYPSEQRERGFGWSVGMAYLCEIKKGELPVMNVEGEKIKTFSSIPGKIIGEQGEFLLEQGLLKKT